MFDFDSALGIEIRKEALVFATVSRGLRGFTLKSHCVIDNYGELEKGELQSRVQHFLNSNGFNRENVILGLPRDQVVVRYAEFPLEVEENLEQVVQYQVGRLEPSEEESSCYDFLVLDRDPKAKSVRLQIVIIPQTSLDRYLHLIRELSIMPAAVRLSVMGLHQLFRLHTDGYGSRPTIVLGLEREWLEIVVVAGPNRSDSHLIPVTAEELTFDRVLWELDSIVPRLKLAGEGIEKIYLAGERGEEFLDPARQRFGDVELLRQGLRIKSDGIIKAPPQHLLRSVGLAVSGVVKSGYSDFNLIPAEKRTVRQRSSLVPTLVLAGLALLLLVALATREYFQQQQLLAAISAQVEQLRPEVEIAQEARRQVEEKSQSAQELHSLLNGRQNVLQVLRELTERIPEDTYLQSLNIQRGKLVMTGLSDGASRLINVLSSSEYLEAVESRYITQDRASGKDKFNFDAKVKSMQGVEP